jgi:hypothetical protein
LTMPISFELQFLTGFQLMANCIQEMIRLSSSCCILKLSRPVKPSNIENLRKSDIAVLSKISEISTKKSSKCYSLRSILLFANMDVSRHILAKSNIDQRVYLFYEKLILVCIFIFIFAGKFVQ